MTHIQQDCQRARTPFERFVGNVGNSPAAMQWSMLDSRKHGLSRGTPQTMDRAFALRSYGDWVSVLPVCGSGLEGSKDDTMLPPER
jgi:hypothetical protein